MRGAGSAGASGAVRSNTAARSSAPSPAWTLEPHRGTRYVTVSRLRRAHRSWCNPDDSGASTAGASRGRPVDEAPGVPCRHIAARSVIMPTHNRPLCLADTLQSLQRQTYPHWEAPLIDDAGTSDLIRAFMAVGSGRGTHSIG
ncbi:MAG: glycosyltransferase [Steroidobacteraceae bacterium]